jgi:hypothetical protein
MRYMHEVDRGAEAAEHQSDHRSATPVPCAARPSTGFLHPDGRCRCFFGGPAPEFAPAVLVDLQLTA